MRTASVRVSDKLVDCHATNPSMALHAGVTDLTVRMQLAMLVAVALEAVLEGHLTRARLRDRQDEVSPPTLEAREWHVSASACRT